MNALPRPAGVRPDALDLARWAVVAHKDDTGFGRQAADLRRVLGVGRHVVIPSERLVDKPLDPASDVRLAPDAPEATLRDVLAPLQGIVFFERPNWHPRLLPVARELGVATVAVPNWEWFQGANPLWRDCDWFACPTRHTLQVVRGFGHPNAAHLTWPLDLAAFPPRRVVGPGRRFVHNAGLVDAQDRKGTRDSMLAFARVPGESLTLCVRLQGPAALPPPDARTTVKVGNVRDPAALYADTDVAVQPSKLEGIGFMVLEAVASGLPVITTDHAPMNEFVAQPQLRARPRWFRRRAFSTQWVPHAYLKLPRRSDLARCIAWCAAHDLDTVSRENRAWAEWTFAPARLRAEWLPVLARLVRRGYRRSDAHRGESDAGR